MRERETKSVQELKAVRETLQWIVDGGGRPELRVRGDNGICLVQACADSVWIMSRKYVWRSVG